MVLFLEDAAEHQQVVLGGAQAAQRLVEQLETVVAVAVGGLAVAVKGLVQVMNDTDLAQKYEDMVNRTPVLEVIEEWSFPTYTRDSKPNADFSLPGSILLRKTAEEVLREIDNYTEAYLYYLCRTYLPLALGRDPTFGLRLSELGEALTARADICEDTAARNACISFTRQIKGIT